MTLASETALHQQVSHLIDTSRSGHVCAICMSFCYRLGYLNTPEILWRRKELPYVPYDQYYELAWLEMNTSLATKLLDTFPTHHIADITHETHTLPTMPF